MGSSGVGSHFISIGFFVSRSDVIITTQRPVAHEVPRPSSLPSLSVSLSKFFTCVCLFLVSVLSRSSITFIIAAFVLVLLT